MTSSATKLTAKHYFLHRLSLLVHRFANLSFDSERSCVFLQKCMSDIKNNEKIVVYTKRGFIVNEKYVYDEKERFSSIKNVYTIVKSLP